MSSGQAGNWNPASEGEPVLQDLDDAFADDLDFAGGELRDREHQLLLAHDAGVLDLQLRGRGQELGRGFGLKLLELDFPHGKHFR